jgi:hypothetical protein
VRRYLVRESQVGLDQLREDGGGVSVQAMGQPSSQAIASRATGPACSVRKARKHLWLCSTLRSTICFDVPSPRNGAGCPPGDHDLLRLLRYGVASSAQQLHEDFCPTLRICHAASSQTRHNGAPGHRLELTSHPARSPGPVRHRHRESFLSRILPRQD